jgi:NAD-dependent dihydropyrimidine dehydrogenase PreA subunit
MGCIRTDVDGKPFLAFEECWYCGACEKDCPVGAIRILIPFLVR